MQIQKLILLFGFFCFSLSLAAQTTNDKEEAAKDDLDYYSAEASSASRPERFSDNLWFGGGTQLGFQSNNLASFFIIGLSPMAGYKVTNSLSFGPRVSLNYNAYRCSANNIKANYLTWEAGMFARMKVFNQFFGHAEYTLESRRLQSSTCSEPIKQVRSVPYVGIGYTTGFDGAPGSEVLLLFRLNKSGPNIFESPYVFRAGFNYNF